MVDLLTGPHGVDRYTEQFPEVQRPGLPYAKLTAEQKTLVDNVIKAMTSTYGAERCMTVAKQSSDKGRYINFFGTPSLSHWYVSGVEPALR